MLPVLIRKAVLRDLHKVCHFTDFWLSGRGKRIGVPGAVDDVFISPSQHIKYIQKYHTFLATSDCSLLGWAVIQKDGSLIHLLVAGNFRGLGIGRKIIETLRPKLVRSKSNQSSGDPAKFYEKLGYVKTDTVKSRSRLDIDKIKPNREKIIDIFEKKN